MVAALPAAAASRRRHTRETYLDLAGNALASAERLRLHRTSLTVASDIWRNSATSA
jgi:hypothetical protein